MANHREHAVAGTISGGVAAAFLAREQELASLLVEAAGGAWTGRLAAALPDIIDPPTSFRHRGIGHGAAPATAGIVALVRRLPQIQERLREEAARQAGAREQAPYWLARTYHLAAEYLLRFLSGAIVGAAAGYASHLVLDAGTPMGLPLFA